MGGKKAHFRRRPEAFFEFSPGRNDDHMALTDQIGHFLDITMSVHEDGPK